VQQGLQQRLLTARKVHRLTAEKGLAAARVVGQATVLDQVDAAPRHPPQQGLQARGQFTQVEWFEQVVVGTGLQAVDPVGHRVPCGEDQHRDLQALAALLLQQLEAVFVGQAEVEHHDVERGRLEHRPRGSGRGHVFDGKALGAKAGDDAAGDQLVVFADQYVHGEPFMKDGD
jgi:D-alanyl-D-alanine carboxypeptidase/D-alanyl-D-alanine-endopeptidase (penicillin-binding protein 4)